MEVRRNIHFNLLASSPNHKEFEFNTDPNILAAGDISATAKINISGKGSPKRRASASKENIDVSVSDLLLADTVNPRPRSASTRTFKASTRPESGAAPPQRSYSLVQRTSAGRITEAGSVRTPSAVRLTGQRAVPANGGPRANGPRIRDLPSRKASFKILPCTVSLALT
jgi:hypothetical protein